MTTALLLRPISKQAFNRRLRELGHQIPTVDPDVFAPLCKELAEPIEGDGVEIDLRVSKPLRRGSDFWEGHRNASGQPREVEDDSWPRNNRGQKSRWAK